jgi:hypothetical protein
MVERFNMRHSDPLCSECLYSYRNLDSRMSGHRTPSIALFNTDKLLPEHFNRA